MGVKYAGENLWIAISIAVAILMITSCCIWYCLPDKDKESDDNYVSYQSAEQAKVKSSELDRLYLESI